jgi:hypothetical protein
MGSDSDRARSGGRDGLSRRNVGATPLSGYDAVMAGAGNAAGSSCVAESRPIGDQMVERGGLQW